VVGANLWAEGHCVRARERVDYSDARQAVCRSHRQGTNSPLFLRKSRNNVVQIITFSIVYLENKVLFIIFAPQQTIASLFQ
jgi:hypothetical protein